MRWIFEEAALGIKDGLEQFADWIDSVLSVAWNYKWALLTLGIIYAIINL